MCTPHCFEILPGSGAHSEDGCQEGAFSTKIRAPTFLAVNENSTHLSKITPTTNGF
jgi:hypothetical protein